MGKGMASGFLPKDHPVFKQEVSLVGVGKSPTSTTPFAASTGGVKKQDQESELPPHLQDRDEEPESE